MTAPELDTYVVCHMCKQPHPLNDDWVAIRIEDERRFTLFTQICPDCAAPIMTTKRWALLGIAAGVVAGLAGWLLGG